MRELCGECKGAKQVYRAKPVARAPITEFGGSTAYAENAYERELIACPACQGEGTTAMTGRIPVIQDGVRVGSVPASFDPATIRSMSPLYAPRDGDFRPGNGVWIANSMLGNGDLEAVPGFTWG